ncbi:hypothetical protein pb186bvf_014475 [Paramecium bursaria]
MYCGNNSTDYLHIVLERITIHQIVNFCTVGSHSLVYNFIQFWIVPYHYRVYIQISFGFTNLSIAFAIFSLFYIIEQYKKAKQRRKQFLKSQRNKLLEQLIKDFIDERVCIIEKDEKNVKFIPIIMNNQLQELSKDINVILKQLKLCNSKESLQQYLYKSIQEQETILCQYTNVVYQVIYQRFILKTCQIFIKIKQLYQNQSSIIDYKELYLRQLNEIQKIKQNTYCSKQMIKVQLKIFVHWFKKYPFCYKIKAEIVDLQYLFNASQFEIILNDFLVSNISSDKLLIFLLLKSLTKIIKNRKVKVYQIKSGILIQVQGMIKEPVNKEGLCFINQILFHIGFVDVIFHQRQNKPDLITLKFLDDQEQIDLYIILILHYYSLFPFNYQIILNDNIINEIGCTREIDIKQSKHFQSQFLYCWWRQQMIHLVEFQLIHEALAQLRQIISSFINQIVYSVLKEINIQSINCQEEQQII